MAQYGNLPITEVDWLDWDVYMGILEQIQPIEFNKHITNAQIAFQLHQLISGLSRQPSSATVEDFLPPLARGKKDTGSKLSRAEALGVRWLDQKCWLKQRELDALHAGGYGMDEVRKALPEFYRRKPG